MTVPQAHLLLAEETAFSFAKHCPSLLAATRYGVRFDPLDPIALVTQQIQNARSWTYAGAV